MAGSYQTTTYINRLGERLAKGYATAKDLEELASFRKAFRPAYRMIFTGAQRNGYVPTGRPEKSNASIVAKLKREKTRLVTMQDIAGLRIVVPDIPAQNEAVEKLRHIAPCVIKDRRAKPSNGYRAVHLIYNVDGSPVEVQVRTKLQHDWAELSEKLADADTDIKYGGGPPNVKVGLHSLSSAVAVLESLALRANAGPAAKEAQATLERSIEMLRATLERAAEERTKAK
jgi:putative GTP pyrophosphokinase